MQKRILAVAVVVCSFAVHGAETLHQVIAKLKAESITESLAKLSDVNMFNLPGLPMPSIAEGTGEWIPLDAHEGQRDLEAIMGNRRFRKVLEHLSGISKDAASEMVNRELSAAMTEYLPLYERGMRGIRSLQFKAGYSQVAVTGPSFATGNVPEGKVVIAGARLKVLALVWTSGMLGLSSSKDQVERVARLAVKQRTEMYGEPNLNSFFKAEMLKGAGLYNRQIISTGLLGVTSDEASEASLLKAAGAKWQARQLNSPGGSLTVKFTSPMDDAHFDILLKELHLSQQTGEP